MTKRMEPRPLTVEEETVVRQQHRFSMDHRKDRCATCRLLATLDAERAARAPEGGEDELADVLHEVMCEVSHHDRGKERKASCYPKYRNIALSAFPRLRAARAEPPETGLREAAQEVLDIIDTATREDDDTTPLYDFLSEGAAHCVDRLRAALEAHGEPQEGERMVRKCRHHPAGDCIDWETER